MSPDRILVTVVGLAAVAAVAWFFWFKRAEGVAAATMSDGYQEVMVLVKGGYTPDTIRVSAGKPVRLLFRREETAACSEQVVLADFGKSAVLPEGQVVPVEFLPGEPGEHEFTCQMGMLRGRLLVEAA
ncbi:MAG: cupredoxin domain-containing protein [Chloroflexi bacterium]|nr:cupredoxin domain-containing protein [Chloroflexota bacterium]